MKVWITKYALTKGIQEVDGVISSLSPERFITTPDGQIPERKEYFKGEGKEWHIAPGSAKIRANEMVAAKIKSLKKSLVYFENLKF